MALVMDSVSKRFGTVQALDRVSLSVEPGRIFGLLGANGAGKTTCMRIVLDILRADEGVVTWQGTPNHRVPRRTWGYLPEERGLYARMKVVDVLTFLASLYGISQRTATADVEEWLDRFRIPEYRDRRVEELSKGNQQKIQFIAAIIHDPAVLIMDEPFSGLDPVNAGLLKEAFLEMRDRGKTVIFSTHQMEQVEELCESIAIIDRGRVVESGLLRDVKRRTGRQVVRLALDGRAAAASGDGATPEGVLDASDSRTHAEDTDWVEGIAGVRLTRRGEDYLEMHVESGTDPETILTAAIARGERVSRFEIADPSLEEIFIERVGHAAVEEERHLARARDGRDATAPAGGPGAG